MRAGHRTTIPELFAALLFEGALVVVLAALRDAAAILTDLRGIRTLLIQLTPWDALPICLAAIMLWGTLGPRLAGVGIFTMPTLITHGWQGAL